MGKEIKPIVFRGHVLMDQNIGDYVANRLSQMKYGVVSARTFALQRKKDDEVLAVASRFGRLLLTHDRDFVSFKCAISSSAGIVVLPAPDLSQKDMDEKYKIVRQALNHMEKRLPKIQAELHVLYPSMKQAWAGTLLDYRRKGELVIYVDPSPSTDRERPQYRGRYMYGDVLKK